MSNFGRDWKKADPEPTPGSLLRLFWLCLGLLLFWAVALTAAIGFLR